MHASEITPSWTHLPGKGVTIGISDEGKFVCSNDDHHLYSGDGKGWMQIPGKGTVISIGTDGDLWCVNKDENIYHWEERGWMQLPGSAVHVSCGNKNHIVIVNKEQHVYLWNNPGWTKLSGKLRYAAIAADGELWGCNEDEHIYRYDRSASKWEKQAGKAVKCAVVRKGSVYVINSDGNLYHMKNNEGKWRQQPGLLSFIATNSHGVLVGATNDDKLYLRPAADYDKKQEHKVIEVLKSAAAVEAPIRGIREAKAAAAPAPAPAPLAAAVALEAPVKAAVVAAEIKHESPFHNNGKYRLRACSGKHVRINHHKAVDGEGDDGPWATFVAFVENDTVRFQNEKGLWLTIADNGMPDGHGLGGPRCVFHVINKGHHQGHHQVSLRGHIGHLGILPNGQPKNAKETGTGEHGTFLVIRA
jgi:hypothetical protein